MDTTQQILDEARKLGKLIKEQDAAKKLDQAIEALKGDQDAQRVLNDYNRLAAQIAEKEQANKPIEVEEKYQMQELHKSVIMNKVLQDFQVAQMDYADLMRKVDEAMSGGIAPGAGGSADGKKNSSGETSGGDESPIIQ
ncbi:YlbF family regulator [Poriferisphaera sp. WC338]|uniref:YlbF family regulator n=1 Tax=Poriferisphaera sp. WC338 TaxID=3425129 RepID=UPI003D81AB54